MRTGPYYFTAVSLLKNKLRGNNQRRGRKRRQLVLRRPESPMNGLKCLKDVGPSLARGRFRFPLSSLTLPRFFHLLHPRPTDSLLLSFGPPSSSLPFFSSSSSGDWIQSFFPSFLPLFYVIHTFNSSRRESSLRKSLSNETHSSRYPQPLVTNEKLSVIIEFTSLTLLELSTSRLLSRTWSRKVITKRKDKSFSCSLLDQFMPSNLLHA